MIPGQREATLATLAAVRLAQGRTVDALAAAQEAMGREEPPPMRRIHEPFIRRIYVEALAAAGDHEGARAALVVARARVLEIATRIGDPALQRTFLEDAHSNARSLALAEEWLGMP